MRKLWEYLKAHRRKKVKWLYVLWTALCGINVFVYVSRIPDGEGNSAFAILWGALGLVYLYYDFFETAGEKEPPVDPRPMDEKLREAFAGLTLEELQAIIDDDLRSEETKAVARELLEERKTEI